MVSKRIKINSLALFLGSSLAFLAFYIVDIIDKGSYGGELGASIGGIVGSLIGGFICGIFIYEKDWHFIGLINIIFILVFAIIAARFFYSSYLWGNITFEPSLFIFILGCIALLTALGTILGYKLGFKEKFKAKEMIDQDV